MPAKQQLIFILSSILLTIGNGNLSACSCIGQRTVEKEIKNSDAVFVGTIISKKLVTLTDSTMLQAFPNDTLMRNSSVNTRTIASYDCIVSDVYKGKITSDTLIIYTGIGGGDCGIGFEVGKKYIVYGETETYFGQVNNDFKFPKGQNTFWTNNCLRTTSYNQEEIREIEKYYKKRE